MITYPTHCHNYNVHAKLPNEKIVHHFYHFAAKVIQVEIDRLLQNPPAIELLNKNSEYEAREIMRPLQPRDIAIIGDSAENDLDLVYIKELLHDARFELCTAKEYQEGLNEVALCYSCDIASLEWPVVFHPPANKLASLKESSTAHCTSLLGG